MACQSHWARLWGGMLEGSFKSRVGIGNDPSKVGGAGSGGRGKLRWRFVRKLGSWIFVLIEEDGKCLKL